MRRLLVLTVLLGSLALPAAAHAASPIPGFHQTAPKAPGWAWCYVEGQPSFWCEVFPVGGPVTARVMWWHVAKCAVAIGLFIAGNVVAAYKIKKLGGVWKAAKAILKAKKGEERAKVIASIFGELSGVSAVVDACSG